MINPTMPSPPENLGRSVLMGFSQIVGWGWAAFMTAPRQNLGFGVLGIAMAVSASNALFWQETVHPAPLFGAPKNIAMNIQDTGIIDPDIVPPHPLEMAVRRASEGRTNVQVQPVIPVAQPAVLRGSDVDKVSNEMLAQAQEVLKSLGMFSGKIDGFYGPLTAQAIRAFEEKNGLPAKGAMTPEVISSIINAPAGTQQDMPGNAALAEQARPISGSAQINNAPMASRNTFDTASASVILDDIIANIPSGPANAAPEVPPAMPPAIAPVTTRQVASGSVSGPAAVETPIAPLNPQIDAALIEKIQFGLAKLGFYNSSVDGIAGETTAKAIREFENFLSYPMTGEVNENVLLWLQEAGAFA